MLFFYCHLPTDSADEAVFLLALSTIAYGINDAFEEEQDPSSDLVKTQTVQKEQSQRKAISLPEEVSAGEDQTDEEDSIFDDEHG
jgi:hypothetical protein